ncbi:MAG: hypothetical protein P8X74_21470 [Reinekea sp.]
MNTTEVSGAQALVDQSTTEPFIKTGWQLRMLQHGAIGFVVLCINFPQFIDGLIRLNVDTAALTSTLNVDAAALASTLKQPVDAVQSIWVSVRGSDSLLFFERSMSFAVVLLLLFLLLAFLISIRDRSLKHFGYILSSLIVGFFTLHLITWGVVTVVAVYGVSALVFEWIGSGANRITELLFQYWWVTLTAVGLPLFILYRHLILLILQRLIGSLIRHWLKLCVILGVLLFLVLAIPIVWEYVLSPIIYAVLSIVDTVVEKVLKPVAFGIAWLFGWLFVIISVIFIAAVSVFVLAMLGSLVISQIQAARLAGGDSRYEFAAGFAIGSFLTLIAIVSVANAGTLMALNHAISFPLRVVGFATLDITWLTGAFLFFLPGNVESFVISTLGNQQAPAFDALLFTVLMTLSVSSLWLRLRGVAQLSEEKLSLYFVICEYFKMVFGLCVFVVLIVFSSVLSDY